MRNDNIDDSLCDLCRDGEVEDDDSLIFCELCNAGVHQQCYRRDILKDVPRSDWFCQRCLHLINGNRDPADVKCCFCGNGVGVLIQVKGDTQMVKGACITPAEWVHITCVNWIKDIYFEEVPIDATLDSEASSDPVDFFSGSSGVIRGQLSPDACQMKCSLCDWPNGVCIQCDNRYCSDSFHVRCAIEKGYIVAMDDMIKDAKNPKNSFVFCERHQPPRPARKKAESSPERSSAEKPRGVNSNIMNVDTKSSTPMKARP